MSKKSYIKVIAILLVTSILSLFYIENVKYHVSGVIEIEIYKLAD